MKQYGNFTNTFSRYYDCYIDYFVYHMTGTLLVDINNIKYVAPKELLFGDSTKWFQQIYLIY